MRSYLRSDTVIAWQWPLPQGDGFRLHSSAFRTPMSFVAAVTGLRK